MRGTGGNRFIPANATRADLLRSINDQLGDLHEYATETGRSFDLAVVSIYTKRILSGLISVSVEADLGMTTLPKGPAATDSVREVVWRLHAAVVNAVAPDDWTGHIPNCGYTHEVPECGCAAFGERLFKALEEVVSSPGPGSDQ